MLPGSSLSFSFRRGAQPGSLPLLPASDCRAFPSCPPWEALMAEDAAFAALAKSSHTKALSLSSEVPSWCERYFAIMQSDPLTETFQLLRASSQMPFLLSLWKAF